MSGQPRDYDEKRDFIRMTVDCDVSYRLIDKDMAGEGRARNLSGRGVLFQTDHLLAPGSILELSIRPQSASIAPLNARVEVVRVEEIDAGRLYEIGAMFHEQL